MSTDRLVRRSREDWRALLVEWESAEQDVESFCEARGVHPRTFLWWRWKLRTDRERRPPAQWSTLEVAVQLSSTPGFELCWADGLTLRVPEHFNPEALARLLAVLDGSRC